MPMLFDESGTEVGLAMLRLNVERLKFASDEMRDSRCDQRVNNSCPEHVAGNREAEQDCRSRQIP